MTSTAVRLPAALESAVNHVRTALDSAAERVLLRVAQEASYPPADRDAVRVAHAELRRRLNTLTTAFHEAIHEKVRGDLQPREARRSLDTASWETLSLVEDHELEGRVTADRIAQAIAHQCEWQLREVTSYMGGLLQIGRADDERNPLRPELIGAATFKAIEAVTTDAEARKLLAREFGLALGQTMPDAYVAVVRDLQARRVQPVGLGVKTVQGPGNALGGLVSGYETVRDSTSSTRSQPGDLASGFDQALGAAGIGSIGGMGGAGGIGGGTGFRPSGSGGLGGGVGGGVGRSPLTAARRASGVGADADMQLVNLLRRLTAMTSRPGALDLPLPTAPGSLGGTTLRGGDSRLGGGDSRLGGGVSNLMAVNLIKAHRDELMQASTGKLDHMVIEVVGSLFDQILSDPRVPPQMARQIARLQLPVLRVALVDPTFFTSRRHPVRRFVNRVASLALAFDEFAEGPGKELLERVRDLVQEIVDGDFDQIELYDSKLGALEQFIHGQTETQVKDNGAASLIEGKESELRQQQRYMQQLKASLQPVPMPDFLRDFASQVWSQALVQAVRSGGVDGDLAQRFRRVGRELVMSVQPKGSPEMRKRFLMQLPTLMKDLNEGMKLVGWPEPAQKAFFAQLLPAHAESLKAKPLSELDHNLLAKQLEGIFRAPMPGTAGAPPLPASEPVEVPSEVIEQRFTEEEAQRIGLIAESAVDWSGKVDIDLSDSTDDAAEATDSAPLDLGGLDINLDVMTPDPAEPARGPQLFDHVRVGFAYQMLLKDQWQKVRLSYVSPGRSFFVFTRGRKHQETISLTARMLARMCETGRLRALESSYLMERATARARRQLAQLKSGNSRR